MCRILRWLGYLFAPIQKNSAFFVFMYALGFLCTQLEITLHLKGAKPYELSAIELFFDLYILCAVLALLPRKLRYAVRAVLYVLFYGAALVDMYCYVKFESTLTPTMLLLVGETNGNEASEFLESYLGWDLVTSKVGWVLLIMLLHVLWTVVRGQCRKAGVLRSWVPAVNPKVTLGVRALLACVVVWLMVEGYQQCWHNKVATARLFSYDNIGDVEHELAIKGCAKLYLPVNRLVFSVYANRLAAKQLKKLTSMVGQVRVDSCSFRSQHIVLVIGESYNKHHSQLFGYEMPTTPYQVALAKDSLLVPFTDVVAPYNLTSFMFKNIFSLHSVGDPGEWCDAPMFPEIFRKAGYRVTFLTNQFLPRAKEAIYDFSGGFFLNNPTLSNAMFDARNTRLYRFDESLLGDYDRLRKEDAPYNLEIIHLMGQHVEYRARYPKSRKHFKPRDYAHRHLNNRDKYVLSDYDNATLYNDSVLHLIVQKVMDRDAIVVYVPDHGDECFGNDLHIMGRMHTDSVDYRLAHEEYEVPFWIWCSPKYAKTHPDVFRQIREASGRPYMTDRLPHLLLYLAGISCREYRPEYNVLSPRYDAGRPRMLKGKIDYDKLKKTRR